MVVWTADGKLIAVPVDLNRRALTGDPVVLMDNVGGNSGSSVSLALNGTLAFTTRSSAARLIWLDTKGEARNAVDESAPYGYSYPRLSPDGTRIALTIAGSPSDGSNDVWIYDVGARTRTRLTRGGGERPEWTPDGKRVIFIYRTNKTNPAGQNEGGLWSQPVDGSGPAEQIDPLIAGNSTPPLEAVVSPDGKTILLRITAGSNARDLYYLTVGANTPAKPWVATKANEIMPRFSPDGKWVAYVSDESEQYEVYVRPFPGPGGRYRISADGGAEPVWSKDGRRIYYIKEGQIVIAEVSTRNGFSVISRKLFLPWRTLGNDAHANYDVAPDGTLLMPQAIQDPKMVVITNWFTAMRKKLASQQ